MSGLPAIAICRGCGRQLDGSPYHTGKPAYVPETGERAKANHYGGWVCSRQCDFNSSLRLEQSMPGHGDGQRSLGCYAQQSLNNNWGQP
jgi:hypothetical protein